MSQTDKVLTVEDLMTLVETGRELAAEVSLKTLLASILDKACLLTDSPDGSVILHDERRDALYFAHAIGDNAAMLLERWGESGTRRIPTTGSKAGDVFTTGRSIVDDFVAGDASHFKGVDSATKQPTESMVCVPLAVGGKRLGVVQILNKRIGNYTHRDLVLLEHFATQSAVAIRNAQLFDNLLAHMGLYASREDNDRSPVELLDELTSPARSETLTILFADMRSFTQLCHVINRPEQTQAVLNDLLGMLSDAVINHRGLVNKFLGDGLMALFRGEEHALRAIRCAFTMSEEFMRLRTRWDEQTNVPLGFLDLGIGIATDTVIVGSIGSDHVRDFTAIGTGVNLAAYLMEHARNGRRILVDRMTYRLVKDYVGECEGPEEFEFKKIGQTVGVPSERYHVKSLNDANGATSRSVSQARPAPTQAGCEVFISYSHKDGEWLKQLQKHLKPFTRGGAVAVWDDTKIQPGDFWRDEINRALNAARVAVLLVSPDFLDSEFIASNELPPLLTAAKEAGLKVLWVPLSASSFDETEIAAYQAAFDPARPLDSLSEAERNQTWVALCKQIKKAVRA